MITTKRLTIRPIEENDWTAIKEIWDDFKNTEFVIYDNDKDTSPESLQSRVAKWAEATRKGNEHMFFATCLKGETIGFTSMNIVAPFVGCGKGNTSNVQIDFMGLLPVACQKGLLQFFAAAPSALFRLAGHSAGFLITCSSERLR